MKFLKNILSGLFLFFGFFGFLFAQNSLRVIPEMSSDGADEVVEHVENVSSPNYNEDENVWTKYRKELKTINETSNSTEKLSKQVSSGIMDRDTLLYYIVYFVKLLSKLGLFIGGAMIIYAGYNYATYIFSGKEATADAIKYAIIGVVVISFSYVIMKILTKTFL